MNTMDGQKKGARRKRARRSEEKPVEFKVRLMVENRPLGLSDLVNLHEFSPNLLRLLALYGHPIEPIDDYHPTKSDVKATPQNRRYSKKRGREYEK